jgi:hypothetical protein
MSIDSTGLARKDQQLRGSGREEGATATRVADCHGVQREKDEIVVKAGTQEVVAAIAITCAQYRVSAGM